MLYEIFEWAGILAGAGVGMVALFVVGMILSGKFREEEFSEYEESTSPQAITETSCKT